jgi:hypothetical protein
VRPHTGLLALLLLAVPAVASAAPLTVYDDQLRNGFADWSWATHNLSQTSIVHAGTAAASFEPDSWQALFLHRDQGIDTAAYSAVDFWIHWPVRRWGGNTTTRYSWQDDISNHASDWFFYTAADVFIDDTRAAPIPDPLCRCMEERRVGFLGLPRRRVQILPADRVRSQRQDALLLLPSRPRR